MKTRFSFHEHLKRGNYRYATLFRDIFTERKFHVLIKRIIYREDYGLKW